MRQRFVFRENWPGRLVSQRRMGFIVYQTVVLLLASGLVWAKQGTQPAVADSSEILTTPRETAAAAPGSGSTLTQAATASSASVRLTAPESNEPAERRAQPAGFLSTTSAPKTFAFHQDWRFWAGVAVVVSGLGVGVCALTAGGSGQSPHSPLGAKSVF